MGFFDLNEGKVLNIWPGINGTFMHTENMTYGRIILDEGTPLPEHAHPHEQWTHVIEGELELTIGGETAVLTAGMSAHMPSNVEHSGKALTDCLVIDCFSPVREDIKAQGE